MVMILYNPVLIIEKTKEILKNVIEEYDFKNYDASIDDLLRVYSADLCAILLEFYPGATVMIEKNFNSCALLINGCVYNEKGKVSAGSYLIANEEELNYIMLSFREISNFVFEETVNRLQDSFNLEKTSYCLRKKSKAN